MNNIQITITVHTDPGAPPQVSLVQKAPAQQAQGLETVQAAGYEVTREARFDPAGNCIELTLFKDLIGYQLRVDIESMQKVTIINVTDFETLNQIRNALSTIVDREIEHQYKI